MNANKEDETPLGKLMHDLRCENHEDMYGEVLKERVRYFKQKEGGKKIMCDMMEKLEKRGEKRGEMKSLIQILLKKFPGMNFEWVKECNEQQIEKIQDHILMNMSYEGFENNGLIFQPENMETTLLTELVSPNSWSDEVRKYSYELGKISYLNDGSDISNIQWAYIQLKHVKPFLEKYVSFEKANSDFEYYALVNLALYLECLENDCLINKNILSYINLIRFNRKSVINKIIYKKHNN